MRALFVAGAGTDVGKTHVSCGLIEALRAEGRPVQAIKPLVSGFDPDDWSASDPGRLLTALGAPLTEEVLAAISPWRYRAALSPDMAAAREGTAIDLEAILDFCHTRAAAAGDDLLLVEGVGGAMSPVSADTTNLDWMTGLGAPVLLVGGSYLGAISHTLTAARVIQAAGLVVAAVVVSETSLAETPFDETLASIGRLSGRPVVGVARDAPWRDWAPMVLDALRA